MPGAGVGRDGWQALGRRDFCRVRETEGGFVDKCDGNPSAGAVGEQSMLVGRSGDPEASMEECSEAEWGSSVVDMESRERGPLVGQTSLKVLGGMCELSVLERPLLEVDLTALEDLPSGLRFANCYALTSARLPSGIAHIPRAFCQRCYRLSRVDFEDCARLRCFDSCAFNRCQEL